MWGRRAHHRSKSEPCGVILVPTATETFVLVWRAWMACWTFRHSYRSRGCVPSIFWQGGHAVNIQRRLPGALGSSSPGPNSSRWYVGRCVRCRVLRCAQSVAREVQPFSQRACSFAPPSVGPKRYGSPPRTPEVPQGICKPVKPLSFIFTYDDGAEDFAEVGSKETAEFYARVQMGRVSSGINPPGGLPRGIYSKWRMSHEISSSSTVTGARTFLRVSLTGPCASKHSRGVFPINGQRYSGVSSVG
jgi:hypothetical protein